MILAAPTAGFAAALATVPPTSRLLHPAHLCTLTHMSERKRQHCDRTCGTAVNQLVQVGDTHLHARKRTRKCHPPSHL